MPGVLEQEQRLFIESLLDGVGGLAVAPGKVRRVEDLHQAAGLFF
jgi:hypothetical protein